MSKRYHEGSDIWDSMRNGQAALLRLPVPGDVSVRYCAEGGGLSWFLIAVSKTE